MLQGDYLPLGIIVSLRGRARRMQSSADLRALPRVSVIFENARVSASRKAIAVLVRCRESRCVGKRIIFESPGNDGSILRTPEISNVKAIPSRDFLTRRGSFPRLPGDFPRRRPVGSEFCRPFDHETVTCCWS